MNKTLISVIIVGLSMILCPIASHAVPDQFIGDTVIYGGQPPVLQPNVLIIIDDSGSMNDPADPLATGSAYNPNLSTPYPTTANCYDTSGPYNNCVPSTVYNNSAGNTIFLSLSSLPTNTCTYSTNWHGNNSTINPYNLLSTSGKYSGPALNSDGTCKYCSVTYNHSGTNYTYSNGQCGTSVTYELGNYIDWLNDVPSGSAKKIDIAESVIGTLIQSTSGVRFGVMTYRYSGGTGQGGTFMSYPVGGLNYISTVKDMDTVFSGTATNRDALVQALNALTPQDDTPLGETMFEAMRYFQGAAPAFGATIGVTANSNTTYRSPIQYSCQKNYVIVITDGMSNADNTQVVQYSGRYDGGCANTINPPYTYTTCDGNDKNHSLAGVAQYMYTHDLTSGLTSTSQNNVTTYTVGFGTVGADQEAVDLLNLAADGNHGGGTFNSMKQGYFPATSAQSLSKALTNIINNIFSVNTSFVAPVVPVNPENRLEFGKRVYMGFFFPEANGFWSGNLKKYGLDTNLNVMDKNGQYANYVDSDLNGTDDRDGALLSADATHQAVDGSFRSSATSYWTTGADSPDGGTVAKGGVGEVLMNRSYTISSVISNISGSVRNIYTYTGTSTNLTDATNKFLPNTAAITASLLGLPGPIITSATTTDVKQLVNYVHGFDVYSSNASAVTHKRAWILGDMLHSKPLVVSYAKFDYDNHPLYEADCTKNKNIMYVGTNDGMLHAFNDCDGSEAWAFIPPDLLPNLQYLPGSIHTYFVDSSAQVFKYLKNANADPNNPDDNPTDASVNAGPLSSAKKDSVILLVGLRRGGGVITEPGQGFYYALDVTDPATPKYLWKISNATSGFSDLGEAWSEPKIGQIAVNTGTGTTIKAAVFLGGGYDNCNEDGRFGATQTFSGSCVGVLATADSGLDGSGDPITSSGLVTAATFTTTNTYKGRGVYVVELATLPTSTSINGLDFSNSGSKIWSYTFTNGLQYSMLSEMAAVDLTGDGYVDRLYMGDAGGNMWRFDLSSTLTSNWTVTKIFSSNPGYTNGVLDGSTGRKIFYRPAVVPDQNNKIIRLYFGTGDREHPLNRAVVDRMYGLFDKGINSSGVITGITTAVTEAKLFDVTTDAIQTSTTQAGVDAAKAKLDLASNATDTTTYGWYIRLDSADRNPQVLCNGNPCPGEKVLATAAVASGTVYMTTYSPITAATATVANPCAGGNLGNSLLYLLDYWSGAAVKNLDATNDSTSSTYNFNQYAFTSGDWTSGKNSVLLRTDRNRHVGSSIPSGAVVICAAGNVNCKWLVGCGGGLCTDSAAQGPGSLVSPVYWRQK